MIRSSPAKDPKRLERQSQDAQRLDDKRSVTPQSLRGIDGKAYGAVEHDRLRACGTERRHQRWLNDERATLARTCLCSSVQQPYEQEPWQ